MNGEGPPAPAELPVVPATTIPAEGSVTAPPPTELPVDADSSAATETTPDPEQQTQRTKEDRRTVARAAVLRRGRQILRLSPKEKMQESSVNQEIGSYAAIADLKEGAYTEPYSVVDRDTPIRIIQENGIYRAARANEQDRVMVIANITAREKGEFIISTTKGKLGVRIPVEAVLDAQMMGILKTDAKAAEHAFTSQETAVIRTHLGLSTEKPLDTTTLREAAASNGMVLTDSLVKLLQSRMIPTPPTGELPKGQAEANARLQETIDKLNPGTVATAGEIAGVVKLFASEDIAQNQAALQGDLSRIAGQLQTLTGEAAEFARKNADRIAATLKNLEEAQEGSMLADGDSQLEEFFGDLENGNVTPEVGQKINDNLAHGNITGVINAAIENNINNMPAEKQQAFKDFIRGVGQKVETISGGFSILALFLLFQSFTKHGG